jgi:hypothetical protein
MLRYRKNTRKELNEGDAVNLLSENESEVPVIAKITDMDTWKGIPGVRQMADLGNDPDEPHNKLVTAKVLLSEIENVRKSPVVLSLKTSQPLRSLLARTIKDIKRG